MTPQSITAAALAAVLLLAACSTDRGPTGPDTRVAQVDITITGASVAVLTTLQLVAKVKNAAGDVLQDKNITWSSADESRATVTAAGLVTGVAEGFVWIKAASEARADSVLLDITPAPVPPPPPPPPPGNLPEIESLSPSVVLQGTVDAVITIHGKNFSEASGAFWNGGSRSSDFVSSTELRIHLIGEDVRALGTGLIRVFNPGSGGGMSNGLRLTIQSRAKLVLTPDVAIVTVGDAVKVRATLYDSLGLPMPSTGTIRFDWLRLDAGTQLETYDAVRDSIRVRVEASGTWRVVGRSLNGLLADTLVITGVSN